MNHSLSSLHVIVVLCGTALAAHGFFYPHGAPFALITMIALGLSARWREPLGFCLGLAACLWLTGRWLLRPWWPLPLLVMLIPLALLLWRLPWLRTASPCLRWGEPNARSWVEAGGFALVAGLALVIWWSLIDYDFTRFTSLAPTLALPVGVLALGVLVYAILNAAAEEILFRGFLQDAFDKLSGRPWLANLLQALCFGLAHFRGFPGGASGVGLAFVYGLMMGHLRQRSRGLGVPWLAHVGADMVIYILVLRMAASEFD